MARVNRTAGEPHVSAQEDVGVLTRTVLELTVRKIDKEKRTVEFVAATEGGVETWSGKQYLLMKGLKLNRFKRNPVILDTHDRWTAEAVVGRAVKTEVFGAELLVAVEFAQTARAETVWQLVSTGFLNALSVGFLPRKLKRLEAGEKYALADAEIEGPAEIVQQWELYEISVVPVPADMDAVRRGLAHEALEKEQRMSRETPPPAPAPTTAEGAQANPQTAQAGQRAEPAPGPHEISPLERGARDEAARVAAIRALAPQGMEQFAAGLILKGLSIEDSRKELLAEFTKRAAPVPATEPPQPQSAGQKTADGQVRALKDITDDVLVRSVCAPRFG